MPDVPVFMTLILPMLVVCWVIHGLGKQCATKT